MWLDQEHIFLIMTHEIHHAHAEKHAILMHNLQDLAYPKFQMVHIIELQALDELPNFVNFSLY